MSFNPPNASNNFSASFTVEQKASIISFLTLLAKCDKPGNSIEEREINKVLSLLDFSVNNPIFAKVRPENLQVFIIENLKTLDKALKYWFMILCYEFINVDGPITEMEQNYLGNIGDAIGVTELEFHVALNQSQLFHENYKATKNYQEKDTPRQKTEEKDSIKIFSSLAEVFPIKMLCRSSVLDSDDFEAEMKKLGINYEDTIFSFEFSLNLKASFLDSTDKIVKLNFKAYYEVFVEIIVVYDMDNTGFCLDFFKALEDVPNCEKVIQHPNDTYFYKYKIPNRIISISYKIEDYNKNLSVPALIFQAGY